MEPNECTPPTATQARLETFSTWIANHLMDCDDFAEMLRSDDGGRSGCSLSPHLDLERTAQRARAPSQFRSLYQPGRPTRPNSRGQFENGLIAAERKPHLTSHVIDDSRVPEQQARGDGRVRRLSARCGGSRHRGNASSCQDTERPDITFSSSVPHPSDANSRKEL